MAMSSKSNRSGLSKERELPEVKVIIKHETAPLQQRSAWKELWQKLISEVNSNESLNHKNDDKEHKTNEEKSSIERSKK